MDRPLREGVSYNRDTCDQNSAPAPPPPPVATAYPDNDDVVNIDWNRYMFEAQGLAHNAQMQALEARFEARFAALGHAAPSATPTTITTTTTTTTTPVDNVDVILARPDVTGSDTDYNERHLIKNEEVLHRKMPEIANDENLSTRLRVWRYCWTCTRCSRCFFCVYVLLLA